MPGSKGRKGGRGRRAADRRMNPDKVIQQANVADREYRNMRDDISYLRGVLGLRDKKKVTEAHLRELAGEWVHDPHKRHLLPALRELTQLLWRYRAATKRTARERQVMKRGLRQDAKFTRVLNDAAFNERMFRLLRTFEAGGRPYALVTIDMDNFSQINNQFGHEVGDVVLKNLTGRLSVFARENEGIAGRFGGEEFRLFVPMMPKALAGKISREQREFYAELRNPALFEVRGIRSWEGWKAPTLSAGISHRIGSKRTGGWDKLIRTLKEESERALSSAKKAGKDRIGIHR